MLLVGTGSYAATTVAALQARGARDIRVFSATGRAERFAVRYGVRAEGELSSAVREAEIVITCTARYIVTVDDVPLDGRRRLVIDLGLPRNVEPAVGDLPGVDLLDLELIGRHASLPDLGPGAHEAVGHAAAAFDADRRAAPAVVALRRHVDAILQSELDRARSRGGDDPRTEAALRHFAGVLLHGPSVRAREFAAEGRLDDFAAALDTLFGVAPVAESTERRERDASA
jgi:glutamyl-tRNA reductase